MTNHRRHQEKKGSLNHWLSISANIFTNSLQKGGRVHLCHVSAPCACILSNHIIPLYIYILPSGALKAPMAKTAILTLKSGENWSEHTVNYAIRWAICKPNGGTPALRHSIEFSLSGLWRHLAGSKVSEGRKFMNLTKSTMH